GPAFQRVQPAGKPASGQDCPMLRTFFVSCTNINPFKMGSSAEEVPRCPYRARNRKPGAARGINFGIGEAIPYVLVEVPPLGFCPQQLLIDLGGNTQVTVDRPAPEFQFQKGSLVQVGCGIQRGGLQIDSWHGL